MTIAWDSFTPWGALIGLASALFILGNGRIAGIAGIVGAPLQALLRGEGLRGHGVRLVFVLGMLLAPWL